MIGWIAIGGSLSAQGRCERLATALLYDSSQFGSSFKKKKRSYGLMFWVLLAEETSYYASLGCILTRESRLIKLWSYEPKKNRERCCCKKPELAVPNEKPLRRTMANINTLSSKEVQTTPRGSKDARERFRWIRCIVKLVATSLFWVLLSSAKKNLLSKRWAR